MLYKKLITHVEPHVCTVSLLEREENSAIQVIINQSINQLFRLIPDPTEGTWIFCIGGPIVESSVGVGGLHHLHKNHLINVTVFRHFIQTPVTHSKTENTDSQLGLKERLTFTSTTSSMLQSASVSKRDSRRCDVELPGRLLRYTPLLRLSAS